MPDIDVCLPSQPLKDWHLLLIVMGFVLVDLIVLVTVSFVNTARLVPVREPDVEHPDTVNVGTVDTGF